MVLTKLTPDNVIPTVPPSPEEARQQSVQTLPDAKAGQLLSMDYATSWRTFILPLWGTRESERWLRWYDRHEYNALWQGATAGLLKKLSSVEWNIKADDPAGEAAVPYFQGMLQAADFGRGWSAFIQKGGRDFLRQDNGWWFEVIAPGDPLREPTGAITGIAYLDSYQCYPTGDPEYPLRYFDLYTGLHLMHRSRVYHIVDMPDGDVHTPGYGFSALRRAISISYRQILAGRYIQQNLDDEPPPGIVVTNLLDGERQRAVERYRLEQAADQKPFWGKQLWLHAKDASDKPVIQAMPFSQAPEKFNWSEYVDIDVNAMALALGVDRQELWELGGGGLGTGAQSVVLSQKARGKTFGDLLTQIERAINAILPDTLTFEFKFRDPQEDKERAEVANAYAALASAMKDTLSKDEVRQLLANQVEAIRDVITVNGALIPYAEATANETPAAGGLATLGAPIVPATGGIIGEDNTPLTTGAGGLAKLGQKDVQATRLDFEADFAAAFTAAQNDDMSRRRFGIVLRALISKYGRRAYADGLLEGGVEDAPTAEDTAVINQFIAAQSGYVTSLGATVYGDGTTADGESKAVMWWNKSIQPFFDTGLQSADANGLYEWVYGDTEHCKDCLRLNGQKHRLKEWVNHGWLPQSDALQCKGFKCQCKLKKTTGRAKGYY